MAAPSPLPRRLAAWVLGALFLGSHFLAFPLLAVELGRRWGWPRWREPVAQALGVGLVVAAIGVLAHCAGVFRRVGEGTPQPLEPPRHLVTSGLYRLSRNPIYVADVALLLGAFLVFGDLALLVYTPVLGAELHHWVVLREEPVLRRRFGASYVDYTRRVPRWLGFGWPATPTREPMSAGG